MKVEQSTKQVRVMLGGEIVANTTRPLMVWEVPYYPTYYFPEEDVRTDLLVESGETRKSPSRGEASQYIVKVNGSEGAAYAFKDPKIDDIGGHYAFVWKSMDHWFEEDEEVWVHARDPYTRIDILPSSRRVRVELDGETVADSTNAFFLYETGLPTRYYMPKTAVRMDLLTPTDTETACPYKGTARYWSVTVDGKIHEDLVWGYDSALPESQEITGMVAFYNEKVDVFIDEELEQKPKTKFG
ncbi:MAG TPA: DUF427 domain-containing protein [Acidimicrobiia bacterium]|nr:DUF427 domain-containing protein [Acidimicrobiia bacterium]